MVFTVLSGILQKHLALTAHSISTRTQLPILSSILVRAKGDSVTLTATDLELSIETTFQCVVDEEGEVAVPAKTFLELLSQVPEGKITLKTSAQNTIQIVGESISSKLQVQPADEFPDIFEETKVAFLTLQPKDMEKITKYTLFATSSEVTKPIWSGVLCERKENEIRFVATDGFRLSLVSIPREEAGEEQKGIVFSSRFLKELGALREDMPIQFYLSDQVNQIVAVQDGVRIAGRKIEGEFPSYSKIIPHEASSKIIVKKDDLLRAVKICSVVARDSTSVLVCELHKDQMRMFAQTASVGESTVTIEGTLKGEENAIAFNPRFLLDGVNAISTDEVVFEMTAPLSPAVLKNTNDESFLHLIMPVRV